MEGHEFIEEFIIAVQQEYPNLDAKYDFDEVTSDYVIKFNDSDMSDKDKTYTKINEMAEELLLDEGIVNFIIAEESF